MNQQLQVGNSEDNNQHIHIAKKMKTSSAVSSDKKGTIYITVGPQCAGKTTILQSIFDRPSEGKETVSAGVDITIDDQSLVYIPVPTNYFLGSTVSSFPTLNQTIHGKSIRERIRDPNNEELTLVIKRLANKLSAQDFASRLRGNNTDLIHAVEQVIREYQEGTDTSAKSKLLPEKVDQFIVESIFKPRSLDLIQKLSSNTNQTGSNNKTTALSALDEAIRLLKSHATNPNVHPTEAPMSWGNTCTRPREFENALLAANLSGRPIEFILYGGKEACDLISTADTSDEEASLVHLPKVDKKTLLVRNINRFIKTGRYVPSQAITDAMDRVDSMIFRAATQAKKGFGNNETTRVNAKFLLDCELVKLAGGYQLNADRTVSSAVSHNNNNYRGNHYQSGRGRHQQQSSGRYQGRGHNSGRGRNIYDSGRGGRSNSGRWTHNDGNRSYSNSGRGYQGDRSGRHYPEDDRRNNGGGRGWNSNC